jgi:hypothetical protein
MEKLNISFLKDTITNVLIFHKSGDISDEIIFFNIISHLKLKNEIKYEFKFIIFNIVIIGFDYIIIDDKKKVKKDDEDDFQQYLDSIIKKNF